MHGGQGNKLERDKDACQCGNDEPPTRSVHREGSERERKALISLYRFRSWNGWRHLHPRLSTVRGLVQGLPLINCPALRRRSKINHGRIRAELDGVLRPVPSPIAGTVYRAMDILIALDIMATIDDPGVLRVGNSNQAPYSVYRACGVPTYPSIM